MKHSKNLTPLAFALGTTVIASLSGAGIANATENPFAMSELSGGYMVAEASEGKCGEGKCGGKKAGKEGKCGEGKCGMSKMDSDSDGKVTKDEFMSGHEKMFAAKDKNGDGVLDASEMKAKEGKCGEGKCGANK